MSTKMWNLVKDLALLLLLWKLIKKNVIHDFIRANLAIKHIDLLWDTRKYFPRFLHLPDKLNKIALLVASQLTLLKYKCLLKTNFGQVIEN